MAGTDSDTPDQAPVGFARVAVSGTGWATGQTVVNKFGTLFATWVIARQLTSDEVGAASLAIFVTKFLSVLPPLNMGDVLISHGPRFGWMSGAASRIAIQAGISLTLLSIALSPLVSAFYSHYPTNLFVGLLVVAAFRPLGESLQVRPLTELRLGFQNRTIAIVDGSVQLAATLLTIAMAVAHMGAWAMVLPQIVAASVKGICYRLRCESWRTQTSNTPTVRRKRRITMRRLRREFAAASGAQYVHSMVDTLPMLVLGKFATESETGFYAFSFNLAAQANTMVASQISSVLQPVLGRMKGDPARQVNGYLRALRMLSALAVPVCLTQAVFGETLFELLFDTKWQPAARVFSILSLSESFFFAAAPTMAMLKAQGRFNTFLGWQACQFIASLAIFPLASTYGASLAVAMCAAAIWSISLPIAVWLGIRHSGRSIWDAVRIFIAPWCTALPIAVAAWLLAAKLGAWGMWGHAAALGLLAPLSLVSMLLATRISQPGVYHEAAPAIASIAKRVMNRIRRT